MPPKTRPRKRSSPRNIPGVLSTSAASASASHCKPPSFSSDRPLLYGTQDRMSTNLQTHPPIPAFSRDPFGHRRLPALASSLSPIQTSQQLPPLGVGSTREPSTAEPASTQFLYHRKVDPAATLSPNIVSGHSSPASIESRGRKRPYEDMAGGGKNRPMYTPPPLEAPPSQLVPDLSDSFSKYSSMPPVGEPGQMSSVSTPSGTTSSFPYFGPGSSATRRNSQSSSIFSNTSRCTLHIRQEPRAARAGPDGRDRRSLDPPPVVQLLINDFDPENPGDIAELKHSFFIVHTRLISARDAKDVSTQAKFTEHGQREVQRLLLGTMVSSPFFCADDPDPDNAVPHPITNGSERPPSPSDFITKLSSSTSPSDSSTQKAKSEMKPPMDPKKLPATFFIFADLSVRKAGRYRLEFSLMKMDQAALTNAGGTVPIIHSVRSEVFNVVNAKDFDQVHPSTRLVRGLLERGAGFPLKLKKGIREGQRRRGAGGPGSAGRSTEGSVEGEGSVVSGDDDRDEEEIVEADPDPAEGNDGEDDERDGKRRLGSRREAGTVENDIPEDGKSDHAPAHVPEGQGQ